MLYYKLYHHFLLIAVLLVPAAAALRCPGAAAPSGALVELKASYTSTLGLITSNAPFGALGLASRSRFFPALKTALTSSLRPQTLVAEGLKH